MLGLLSNLRYKEPPENTKVFERINKAVVEGRELTEADWREIVLATHSRLLFHEQACFRISVTMLWMIVVLVLMVGSEHVPRILKLLSLIA